MWVFPIQVLVLVCGTLLGFCLFQAKRSFVWPQNGQSNRRSDPVAPVVGRGVRACLKMLLLKESSLLSIKASIEPTLQQCTPDILSFLNFSNFALGTVQPQFTRVSVVEDGETEGITFDLDVNWDGNPLIILDVNTGDGVTLPVQVKNLSFVGIIRLTFNLCSEVVCFSLIQKKKFDFTLEVIGGDTSTIPGISSAVEDTIRNAVALITWPIQKVIPIFPEDYSDLELKPVGSLKVTLLQATDLTNKDTIGKSDPYAFLYVHPSPSRMKKSKIIVYNDEGHQASELIGCAAVQLKDLEPGKVHYVWLKLVKDLEVQREKKSRGEFNVHLKLLYSPLGLKNDFTNPFKRDISMKSLERVLKSPKGMEVCENGNGIGPDIMILIVRGVLSITIISAEDLMAVDVMGKADPYVVVTMKKSGLKNKTQVQLIVFQVVNDSLNPVWNQTFDFVLEDGLGDVLILELYYHVTFEKDCVGRCILTLTEVILKGKCKGSFVLYRGKSGRLNPLYGTKSGRLNPLYGAYSSKLNLHLKWMPQSSRVPLASMSN